MKEVKIAAFGCTHCPLNDKEFEDEFLLPQLEDFQPDLVVHLGDLFEAQHASRWEKIYDFTIDDEYAAAREYCERVESVTPKARHLFIMGNHDKNFITPSRVPTMYGDAMDWRNMLKWEQKTEDYVNDIEWGTWRWGQVVFSHGYPIGRTADEDMAVQFALPRGSHHLHVGAHTHRPIPVRRSRLRSNDLPVYFTNPGCGRDLKPVYVKRANTTGWGQGITLITARDWRYMNGFVPTTAQWEAETRVFKMGSGYKPDQADCWPTKETK